MHICGLPGTARAFNTKNYGFDNNIGRLDYFYTPTVLTPTFSGVKCKFSTGNVWMIHTTVKITIIKLIKIKLK